MAPIDAAPPGRWAFLHPWCRTLRDKLHLEGRAVENSARWDYHWVAVRLPHSPQEADVSALRRIGEALDLLARVAAVDNAAWRALLVHQCRVPRDEDDQPLDCELLPRFRFVFNEKFVEPGALSPADVCKRFFMATSAARASEDYLEARRALAEVETSLAMKYAVATPIPYELQFELVSLPSDILETHLRDLSMMLGTHRSHEGGGTLLPMKLDSIRLDVGGVDMTWPLTQRLSNLLRSGLPFSLFAFSLKKITSGNYEQMQENVGRFLRSVVCGKGREEGYIADTQQSGVDTLSVGCYDCDEWQFAALCSAIGSAFAMKHLRLYGVIRISDTEEVRRWKWQWLTYALFRTSTKSSVARALVTAAQLTRADTLAVAVAIHSNSPPTAVLDGDIFEENLLNIHDLRRDECGHFLTGTELALIHPGSGDAENTPSTVVLESDSWLHIVNDDGNCFDIVLPGFGIARVGKLHMIQVDTYQQLPEGSSVSGLKALTLAPGLHSGDDGGKVLADFLELVGSPLRSLALYAVGSYPISLASICTACPQLTDLFLEGIELTNPSGFCDDAERTESKLTCLGLVNVFTNNDDITQLARTIASPTSHIAQHLSELGISGSEASCPLDDTNVQSLLSMLETNRKLTYLSLGMSPELQLKYHEAFLQQHGELLPVVRNKFPLASKLSFLSAVRGRSAANLTTLLDDAVLSLILSFAATCAVRAVTIHYDD